MELGAHDWTVSIWLVAVREAVAPDEVHRFWNVEETPMLDAILARSPALRLGTTEVALPENVGFRGPVGRVFDVLSHRGTTPDYVLPLVDHELSAELLASVRPLPADPPFDVVSADDLEAFLSQHAGERLAARSQPPSET